MRCTRCGSEFPYDGRPCCPYCGRAFTPDEIMNETNPGQVPTRRRRKKKHTFLRFLLVLCILCLVFVLGLGSILFNALFPSGNGNMKDTQVAASVREQTFSTPLRKELGGSYTPEEKDFLFIDSSRMMGYVDHVILVVFKSGVSDQEVKRVAALAGGELIGCIDGLDEFQIRVTASGEEALNELCSRIWKEPSVSCAMLDRVGRMSFDASADFGLEEYMPDDPWNTYGDAFWAPALDFFTNLPVKWSMIFQGGNNWWQEVIGAPSAWAYSSEYSQVSVGIIDGGFDTGHEDLNITVVNADANRRTISEVQNSDADARDELNHGTHVAGIIGATRGNSRGINGILSCPYQLYGYAVRNANYDTTNQTMEEYDRLLAQGCRVINKSRGYCWKRNGVSYISNGRPTDDHFQVYPDSVWDDEGKNAALIILTLLDKCGNTEGYPDSFLLVNSAGNDEVDAIYNGVVCSVTTSIADAEAAAFKGSRKHSGQDVMDSIIVVGAVKRNKSYGHYQYRFSGLSLKPLQLLVTSRNKKLELTDFSNFGNQVTVCAPGDDIYSTYGTRSGNYKAESGTSMASPIVAASAAQVWALNTSMTAGEVKRALVSTAASGVKAGSSQDSRAEYGMVNLKDAVESILLSRGSISRPRTDGDLKKMIQYFLEEQAQNQENDIESMSAGLLPLLEAGKFLEFLTLGFQIWFRLIYRLLFLILQLILYLWIEI